jgi:hypothetical protein
LLLLVVITSVSASKAQNINHYFFKAKTGVALEAMSEGTHALIGANADGAISPTTPFFPFIFSGKTYDQFSVSEDGVIVLGNGVYSPYVYDNYFMQSIGYPSIPSANATYPIILPWAEDLNTADGGVDYRIMGSAPARKLIIQYKVNVFEDGASTFNKTFQVWLFEGSNDIQFVYGNGLSSWYSNGFIGAASSSSEYLSVNSLDHKVSSTDMFSNSGTYPDLGTWPGAGVSYIFSPKEIVEAPPVVVADPITANLAVSPEYPVPGQLKQAIYLGYGLQSVTLNTTNVTGGVANSTYTYSWTPSTGLSDPHSPTPIASPTQSTTYTVKIEDGKGNYGYKYVTVYVVDARCGDKIKLCRSKAPICVSLDAVQYQLATGAVLGGCNVATSLVTPPPIFMAANRDNSILTPTAATASFKIYPNPSSGILM